MHVCQLCIFSCEGSIHVVFIFTKCVICMGIELWWGYHTFIKYIICKYVDLLCGFSFHSVNSVFLIVMEPDLSIYSFIDYTFSVIVKQFVPNLEKTGKDSPLIPGHMVLDATVPTILFFSSSEMNSKLLFRGTWLEMSYSAILLIALR